MWWWLQRLFIWFRRLFAGQRKTMVAKVPLVQSDAEYFLLLGELLDRLVINRTYGTLQAWSIQRGIKEGELAVWLRGVELDEFWRGRLELLVKLRRGDLSLVAEEILGTAKTTVQGFSSDDAEEWFDRGNSLFKEGRYEEAITSFDKAIEHKPDYHVAWCGRGVSLFSLGRYEETIINYDKAIEHKPDYHVAWNNRGISLFSLGRYEEAIINYEKAIEYKPDYHEAWYSSGISLFSLGRYEKAIASYEKAIEHKPDFHEAWYNRGSSLSDLGRYEKAIASYEKAIEHKPDFHQAWNNCGISLSALGRDEKAIASYEKAIEHKPDFHQAWFNQGNSLFYLGRYEEAIINYEKAIEHKPDFHEAWDNRGIYLCNLRRYEEAIINYQQGLRHLQPTTHPEGWGVLHRGLGRLHYARGQNNFDKFRLDSRVYYHQALAAFQEAATTLPKFPELYLELIQDFMKVYSALREPEKANSYCEQGRELFKQLLNNQAPLQRRKLLAKFNSFRQLEVDILLQQQQPIPALEAAELCKNLCLESLLCALEENIVSPSFAQIQTLLQPHSAIVYWHFSPSALSTFILQPGDQEPQVFYSNNLTELQNWITQWDKINTVADTPDTTNSKKKNTDTPLGPEFTKIDWPQLQQILEIDKIHQHLAQIPGITNLILIPHKDLHRLPLHQFFNYPVTYLPSLQIALNLQQKGPSTPTLTVDLIEQPQGSDLPNAVVEIATIRALLPKGRLLKNAHTSKPEFLEFIGKAEDQGNTAKDPHPSLSSQRILHFTGHGQHFARRPQESCLYLNNNETITCPDLATSNLKPYHLIVLSACQTSIVHHQKLSDEYIGLVSACLSGGASYTISTLWEIADPASSHFFIYFYQQLAQNIPAPQALHNASQWLRNVTNAQLSEFYAQLQQHPKLSHQALELVLEKIRVISLKHQTLNPTDRPYQDPYYWAAFTISGIAPQAS
jgi:tetratricopeptide (TPR) repeat protein/CHAT domain-containing protein